MLLSQVLLLLLLLLPWDQDTPPGLFLPVQH
jgi:hypothetical protein